jgi:hypothetical protein
MNKGIPGLERSQVLKRLWLFTIKKTKQPRVESQQEVKRRESPAKQTEIERVLSDPAASIWLKKALGAAMSRDPVDAINDAEILSRLERRCLELFERRKSEGNGAF